MVAQTEGWDSANGYRVSFGGDKIRSKVNRGDGCITVNVLKTMNYTGVGQSRYSGVSTRNTEFILVLFINYCISVSTAVNLLWPTPAYS